ncbi:DoxX family protein [Streptomyces sp. NPDC006632]|uniref:DoxX family protein n=1 Tax=unclassified Streptomyces TaxID=2593676 RepID=UPI002E1FD8E9
MTHSEAPAARTAATSSTGAGAPSSSGAAGAAGAASTRRRRAAVAATTARIVLALFYGIASALPKLLALPAAVTVFDEMGWGSGGMYAIGALELAGAVGLLIRPLSSLAALCLSALMVGAFITQITVMGGENAATPLILTVPLLAIAWHERSRLSGLRDLLGVRR